MEGVSMKAYKGVRNYWKRRKGYERLNGSDRRRRTTRSDVGSTRRRRLWRIKIKPKLRVFRMSSPKKFFIWLRDAYVKMMMGFANSRVCASGYGGGAVAGDGVYGFGKGPLKEYDEKMIVEIYKSLVMAQGQLVPRDAAKLSSRIACSS
ncbi:Binding protein [Melia azedarach]|uniref:Binding protein n=1 Tax=Melia azedarach TaxID=155640 RepID=A0ACC1YX44_MELAZ|nr:Binding protein [Melia azedarach]